MSQPSKELRELRLWHWRQFKTAHKLSSECVGWLYASIEHDKATFHMRAVQALNDCFPIGDYAETDDEQQATEALPVRRPPP